ncbi:MAG: hypothetical protein KAW88_09615, partial [Candidatus Cloacimonetes bacterium]|nr:hypothetical protein [Candidatus Cloacimonadota bacterium]
MSDNIYKILFKIGWVLFFLFILLNLVNWGFTVKDKVFIRTLPFDIENGKAINFKDSTLVDIFQNKVITSVDTLTVKITKQQAVVDTVRQRGSFNLRFFNQAEPSVNIKIGDINEEIQQTIGSKKEIEITYADSVSTQSITIQTIPDRDYSELINIGFNALFLLFIFFNSYLLLKYSEKKENILIVLFLLLLSCPSDLPGLNISRFITFSTSGFLGVLFYHFMIQKVKPEKKVIKIYLMTVLLMFVVYILSLILNMQLEAVLYVWSIVWIFVGFIILWKAYKKTGSIALKRLLNAFRGIIISLVSIIITLLFALLLYIMVSGSEQFGIQNIQTG